MSPSRISPADRTAVAVDAALHALQAAAIDAVSAGSSSVVISLDGIEHSLEIEPVAYCTGQRARDLVARRSTARFVVSEKITTDGRHALNGARWSWLDRRGRLHVHAPGVRIDIEVPPDPRLATVPTPDRPITGRSGLTVAYWLCAHPTGSLSPTKSAGRLALAPSTISTAVRRLDDAGLVDDNGAGIFPELFWELASSWQSERTWLLGVPRPERHRTADSQAPGWRRTGTPAAVAYGAPVVSTQGEPVELYVVGPVEISIAAREYGAARPGQGAASIAVAPVAAVNDADPKLLRLDGWVAAPKLAVALDLAQDRARGRQILEDWDTDDAIWR